MRRTARDFDSFVAKNVTNEWEAQKQRIFEHFGLAPRAPAGAGAGSAGGAGGAGGGPAFNGGMSAFGASSFGRSRLGGGSAAPVGSGLGTNSVWAKSTMGGSVLGKSVSRPAEPAATNQSSLFADVDSSKQVELSRPVQIRQQRYAQAVKLLNETRLTADPGSGSFPLMGKFGDITAGSGTDMLTAQLHDSWKLLASVAGETETGEKNPVGAQERQFVRDHILNTAPNSPEAARIRKKIEKSSRRFLEKQ